MGIQILDNEDEIITSEMWRTVGEGKYETWEEICIPED